MLNICLYDHFKPFSNNVGTQCLVPFSHYTATLHPSFFLFEGRGEKAELDLEIEGPVQDFTVQQNLDRGWTNVWGRTPNGKIDVRICALKDLMGLAIIFHKIPGKHLKINFNSSSMQGCVFDRKGKMRPSSDSIETKDTFIISAEGLQKLPHCESKIYEEGERLSLGCHKKQDWEMISRRRDIREILPLMVRMAAVLPICGKEPIGGNMSLLEDLAAARDSGDVEALEPLLVKFFLASFTTLVMPRLYDSDHQGISHALEREGDPCTLIKVVAAHIRRLFIEFKEEDVYILPSLPPQLHCGRYLKIPFEEKGYFDVEWTKKKIFRLSFHACKDCNVTLHLKKGVKQYRMRKNKAERGMLVAKGKVLSFEARKTYFFDNFRY